MALDQNPESLLESELRLKPRIRVAARRDWLQGRPKGWLHTCCGAYPDHHPECRAQRALAKANGELEHGDCA